VDADADLAMDRLFELAVVLGDLMNRRLAEHGLTPARAEVLWLLHTHGELTQRRLSELLQCTPRNVTGLVDALQSAGFVARTRHPEDRRALLVALTESGATLITGWRHDRDHNTAAVFADTPAADVATFVNLLDDVLASLRAS
jgi:DNA-binding MarR family transcriptional regulator